MKSVFSKLKFKLNFTNVVVAIVAVIIVVGVINFFLFRESVNKAEVLDKVRQSLPAETPDGQNTIQLTDPESQTAGVLSLEDDEINIYLSTNNPREIQLILQDYADKLGISVSELRQVANIYPLSNQRATDGQRGVGDFDVH